jgi:hypothetical protein
MKDLKEFLTLRPYNKGQVQFIFLFANYGTGNLQMSRSRNIGNSVLDQDPDLFRTDWIIFWTFKALGHKVYVNARIYTVKKT